MKKFVNIILIFGVFCIFLSVFFLKNTANLYSINIPNSLNVEVSTWPNGKSKAEIYDSIKSDAKKYDYTVYKIVDDEDSHNKTIIPIYGKQLKYDSFNPYTRINYHNLMDMSETVDVRGSYLFVNIKADHVKKLLKNLEFQGIIENNTSTYEYINIFNNSGLNKLTYIYLFLLFSTLIFYILYSYREVAIKLLNGYTRFRIYKDTIMHVLIKIWKPICLIELLIGVTLYFYNSWHQIFTFFILSNLLILALVIIFSIMLGISSFLYLFVDTLEAVRGKFNVKLIALISVSLKLMIALFIVFSVGSSINVVNNLHYLNSIKEKWKQVDKYVVMDLSRTFPVSGKESNKADNIIREVIKENKDFIFVQSNVGADFTNNNYDPEDGNVMTVNGNYFSKNKVKLINGHYISSKGVNKNNVVVYIPEDSKVRVKKLEKRYLEWLSFEGFNLKNLNIEYKTIKSEQKVFTYNSDVQQELSNPVIVEINVSDINNDFLITTVSPGQVLFNQDISNSISVKKMYRNGLLGSFTNVNKYAITQKNKEILQLVTNIIILSISIIFGFIFMFFVLRLIVNYFAREISVKLFNGWSVVKIFKNFFCLIILINCLAFIITNVIFSEIDLKILLGTTLLLSISDLVVSSCLLHVLVNKRIK